MTTIPSESLTGTSAIVPDLPAAMSAFSPAALQQLKVLGMLPQCVRSSLTLQDIETISISQDEQNQLLRQYCQQKRIADEAALRAHLQQQSKTLDALASELSAPLKMRRVAELKYGAKAEARFLDLKESLDQVVYSLLRVRDADLARELYLRLDQQEATFADLAAEYSEGPEKKTNGIVGPAPLTQAHPVLAEQLRTQPPGRLIPPFAVEGWWLVVRLENYKPAEFNDEMAAQMAQLIYNESLADQVSRILSSIQARLDNTDAP